MREEVPMLEMGDKRAEWEEENGVVCAFYIQGREDCSVFTPDEIRMIANWITQHDLH